MLRGQKVTRFELERAARVYLRNMDASRALGIATSTFRKFCRRYGIETPGERNRRVREEWSGGGGISRRDVKVTK